MTAPLWLPGAIRKQIAAGANDPVIVPVGDVFHVAVSETDSLFDFFNGNPSGIESTGYIRRDGTVEQYRPYVIQCDAQAAGNSWEENGNLVGLCSWETQGMGMGEWTDAQLATIKRIITIRHEQWGVPLRLCPTATSSGFGYHRLHSEWNPNGHTCPGPDRVRQFEEVIVPWMGQEEGDMPLNEEDKQWISDLFESKLKLAGDLIKVDHPTDPTKPKWSLSTMVGAIYRRGGNS